MDKNGQSIGTCFRTHPTAPESDLLKCDGLKKVVKTAGVGPCSQWHYTGTEKLRLPIKVCCYRTVVFVESQKIKASRQGLIKMGV